MRCSIAKRDIETAFAHAKLIELHGHTLRATR